MSTDSTDTSGADSVIACSVIVPFAESESEGAALQRQLGALGDDCEVILVRAGPRPEAWPNQASVDGPAWHEYHSPPGRARQMNFGASRARGRWLWFVHADSRLHADALDALHAFVAGEDALGWFDLRYRDDGPRLTRINALGANLRSRWMRLPFGDQGLLLPACWFGRLGGYDETATSGEDHLLVWHARAAGLPMRPVGAVLSSSARKYAAQGWWRTTFRHLCLTVQQAWPEWRRLRGRDAP